MLHLLSALCIAGSLVLLVGCRGAAPPRVSLVSVADLPTQGCAGFKHFALNGSSYLAIANFWDGVSHGMAAKSELVRIDAALQSSDEVLTFSHVQSFPTKGAHGWDYFEAASSIRDQLSTSIHFLTVPNYYGCGSDRGPAADDCHNTIVYRASSHHSRHQPVEFKLHQSIGTAGPAQTNHLITSSGQAYLVVGENFNHEVCLYKLQQVKPSRKRHPMFEKYRCLHVPGAGAVAVAAIGRKVYLIASSYHSSKTGWATRTPIFVADDDRGGGEGGGIEFSLLQEIDTFGCHDVSYAEINNAHYVFLAEDRSSKSPRVNSTLLVFNPSTQIFDVLQKFPTHGAHGGKLFRGPDGHAYVMIANFGDRKKKKYKAMSRLWRQQDAASGGGVALFEKVAEVLSYGATSAEWFVMDGRHYVVLANEGDLSNMAHQVSQVLEVQASPSVQQEDEEAAARADDQERDDEA